MLYKSQVQTKRSYGQFCGVARALDVIGDRWTLLMIRELILGPQRYRDILDALPGIGTNLLARRLRDLDHAGIVQRRKLPRPAGSTVYELTHLGRELEPIVIALGRWGRKFLAHEQGKEIFQARYLLFALRANFVAKQARGITETYELRTGDEVVHARVQSGRLEVGEGPALEPDLVIEAPLEVLLAISRGDSEPGTEIGAGRLELKGKRSSFRRFWAIFEGQALFSGDTEAAS